VEALPLDETNDMSSVADESKVRSLEAYRRLAGLGVIVND